MITVNTDLYNAVVNEEMPKTLTVSPVSAEIKSFNWYKVPVVNETSGTYSFNPTKSRDITNDFRIDLIELSMVSECVKAFFILNVRLLSSSIGTQTLTLSIDYKEQGGTQRSTQRLFPNFAVNTEKRIGVEVSNLVSEITAVRIGVDSVTDSAGLKISQPQFFLDTEGSYAYDRLPDYSTDFATAANLAILKGANAFTEVSNSNITSESFDFEESICSADSLKLGGCETAKIGVTVFDSSSSFLNGVSDVSLDINSKGTFDWKSFAIKEVSKEAKGGTIFKKLYLYDRTYGLGENAYSWYSQYMWGMSMNRQSQYANYHFDYERNIFTTYWNLARSFGVEDESRLDVEFYDRINMPYATDGGIYYDYCDAGYGYNRLYYKKYTFNHTGFYTAYMVDYLVANEPPNYKTYCDSLLRGASDKGSIFAEFFDSNGDNVLGEGGFLYDCRDIILPPEDTASITLYVPYVCSKPPYQSQDSGYPVTLEAWIYGVDFKDYDPYDILNATAQLPYYSYVWRKPTAEDICKADSSITARKILRSLMELCGCFFRIGRDGKPQFVYASEHGLYPNNTLFPADTLFPKKSSDLIMPTAYYMSAKFAEYQIDKFGGVQVIVSTRDNTGAACRWEYWEDDSSDNAYLIDDNVFLCAEEFVYEAQATGNITTLLQNIYGAVKNLQYTPYSSDTVGTPFLEGGDRFTLLTKNDGFESFIFQRKLRGIQALRDHFEARGFGNTPRVNNFEWES